jgi:hypothetical protein
MSMKIQLAVVLALLAAAPAAAAPKCDRCIHACLLAQEIVFAEKVRSLYGNADLIATAKDARTLTNHLVPDLLDEWSKANLESQAPCWQLAVDHKVPGADDPEVVAREGTGGTGSSTAMDTDWSRPECKVTDVGHLGERVCRAIADASLKHEAVHHDMCTDAYGAGGADRAARVNKDKWLVAIGEVAAYTAQIQALRDSLRKLTKKKGCGLQGYSDEQLAPSPTKAEAERTRKQVSQIADIFRAGGVR